MTEPPVAQNTKWTGWRLEQFNFQMPEHSPNQKKSSRFVTLCGRKFRDTDPAYFPRVPYRGRTIYLCTDFCLGAFLADPDIFYKVHRNSEKGKK